MKIVCAWCTRVLKDGPPEPVSHGICPDCLVDFEKDAA